MKLEKQFKPELSCAKGSIYESIAEPCLTSYKGQHVLVASNRVILTVVPVDIEPGDTAGQVTQRALSEARRQMTTSAKLRKYGTPTKLSIKAESDKLVLDDGTSFPRKLASFPAFDKLIQADRNNVIRFGINPTNLLNLAKALGSANKVELEVDLNAADAPIKVMTNDDRCVGVIMPIRLADKSGTGSRDFGSIEVGG